MAKYILQWFVGLMCFTQVHAQFDFSEETNSLNISAVRSGAPMAVIDINGDFLDDIVRLDGTSDLYIDYQGQDNTYTFYGLPNVTSSAWAMVVADLNNDGMSEVVAGGAYNGVSLVEPDGNGGYTRSSLDGPGLFVQGSNFVDINNDGYVDFFSCHDDGPNQIWGNDGNGNLFYNNDDFIDLAPYEGEETNSGNYGSVWTDFDSDGDLDLYIAKCRQGVNNTADARRINQLWVNDGNNNYTEAAADYDLAIGWQSWTAEFQDIDNDGDFDCFITNHDAESQLLENVNNIFVDITTESGINVDGLPVQAAMKDFDNDGFVDLLVTGQFYKNNGDKTFSLVSPNPFGNIHSFAIGDLNHDGFLDVCAGYGNGFNGIGSTDDKVWINETNDNNWFAVNLIGQESNRGGIGTRIELNGSWGTIVREVRSGESYGIVHSLTQHFGIGTADEIDSVVIKWPSGVVDIYNDPNINEFLTVIENTCVALDVPVFVNGETIICTGETTEIVAPIGYSYVWSTGETTQMIEVGEEGSYIVTVTDNEGCIGISESVSILFNPEQELVIDAEGELNFCVGESVFLTVDEGENFEWSTGSSDATIEVFETGLYSVTAEGACETLTSNIVEVETLPTPEAPIANDVASNVPTSFLLTATGTNITWYDAEQGGNIVGEGNNLVTPVLEQSTTYYAQDASIIGGGEGIGGAPEHTGSSEFSGNQFNGTLVFNCLEPFILNEVTVYTDTEGTRIIELVNSNGEVLNSKEVSLSIGENVIELGFEIEPSVNLSLTTNAESNITNFGFESPRMRRTSESAGGIIEYPYNVANVASLFDSNFGDSWYYYYYDWKVELPSTECTSPRTAVEAIIDETIATYQLSNTDQISVYPNPTSDILNIEIQKGQQYQFKLMNMNGKAIKTKMIDSRQENQFISMDVSNLPKGMYVIQFFDSQNIYNSKIVIQ